MRPLVVVAVVLIVAVSAVVGTHQTGHSTVESFETGDLSNQVIIQETGGGSTIRISGTAFRGNHSLESVDDVTVSGSNVIRSNYPNGVINNSNFNVTFRVRLDTAFDGENSHSISLGLTNSTNDTLLIGRLSNGGHAGCDCVEIDGVMVNADTGGTQSETLPNPPAGEWLSFNLNANETHITFTVKNSTGGVYGSVSEIRSGHELNLTESQLRYRTAAGDSAETNPSVWFDYVTGIDTGAKFDSLELDVKGFMEHGSTQTYKVLVTDDNETTDVTDAANVTSGNTSVITVDDSTNELVATSDESVNQQVEITAEYQGVTTTENVTVANKTLNNMPILPPPTWPSAVFGSPGDTTGATNNWPGAVQLQWIFVSLALGALVANITHNSFIGTATVPMLLALGWAAEWISDAILILSILFLLWITVSRGFGEIDPRTFKK